MNNEVMTIDTNNFNAMAHAMGMSSDVSEGKSKASTLARLRISHAPIMGQTEVKGKKVNVEVVPGGTYKLQIPDGETYYASDINIRPYMQRFMYKRFIKGHGDQPNKYVKTVMSNDLNVDLKDNDGGFNCGKPAGYIQDFKALPQETQDLIRQIKRVRVLFGTVKLTDPFNGLGDEVTLDELPFIWEIDNRDAFKDLGTVFSNLAKQKRLPVNHMISAFTEEQPLPNGSSFYLPRFDIDMTNSLEVTNEEQKRFADFLGWVQNYNEYIINEYSKRAIERNDDDEEEYAFVSDIVDIDTEED